ncbi:MAG: Hpt domain-containing protein [Pseudomonadota bacterium]|nr:Hpt domain-containing protein [Pseudomonadota bacterium]
MVDLSLLQDFIAETVEYLEEMEDSLLRLEADPGNRMMLDDIFRSAHTIKGAAEYLGIERIAELSRTIENLLYHQLQRDESTVSREVIDLLLAGRERLGRLTENLNQTQIEEIEIDDLVERIRTVDTTSRISEEVDRVAAGDDKQVFTENENYKYDEDENDEELYTIFLGQIEEKITDLQTQTAALPEADKDKQITILEFCLAQIDQLNSSANYMGYDQLTTFYEKWKTEIQAIKERLYANEEGVVSNFIGDCMEANITALISRYPRLQIPEPLETLVTPDHSEAPEKHSLPLKETEIFCDSNVDNTDTDADNSRDILEEYVEAGETAKGDTASDTNLFEKLSWSFDSRLKQSEAKATTNPTEIESELFSSSASPSANPETFPAIADILSDANKPIESDEATALTAVDDYEEENDEELFAIFHEQLEEKLSDLQLQTAALQEADNNIRIDILKACLEQIDRLCSSANYMGYEQLTSFYEKWAKEIVAANVRLQNHEDDFIPAFITECMQANIATAISRVPHLTLLEEEPITPKAVARTENETPFFATAETPSIDAMPEPKLIPDEEKQAAESHAESPQAAISDLSMLPDFIAETREHLEEMEENLLLLDANFGKRETLDDIFRSVHTIKGAAEYLGIDRIAKLTHNLENLLYQLRQNQLTVNREVMSLLMAGWDRVSLLTKNLEQTQIEQAGINDLLERIRVIDGSSQITTTDKAADNSINQEIETTDKTDTTSVEAALKAENAALLQGTDRRDPDQSMRRQSDQINEKILKQSIRVDAGKIDALMNQVGELVVSRAGFTQLLTEMRTLQQELKQKLKLDTREMRQLTNMTSRLSEATTLFDKVTNELQEEVMKVRMLPISQLFNRYPRLVFDLVRDTGKQVELDIHGEETELDKMVIEEISDPLIHIIRNAVDHGIETTAERLEKGKPETGTIQLQAYHEGNHVVIEIMDDGRGLDLNRIKEKALAGKFVSLNELEQMSTRELTGLIMMPGFSTADSVTHISGRGVGMDVVRKNIEKLNGTIEIETTPEVAMRFRIKIPLTLAIIPALRVRVASELFTIPLSTVEETLRISRDKISTIEGVEVMSFRESTLPLVRMSDLFNLERTSNHRQQTYVVVVSTGMKRMGLVVDALLGQEEVVIKPLEDYIQEKSGFSGATILGDGRISLILDVYELINLSINQKVKK